MILGKGLSACVSEAKGDCKQRLIFVDLPFYHNFFAWPGTIYSNMASGGAMDV